MTIIIAIIIITMTTKQQTAVIWNKNLAEIAVVPRKYQKQKKFLALLLKPLTITIIIIKQNKKIKLIILVIKHLIITTIINYNNY